MDRELTGGENELPGTGANRRGKFPGKASGCWWWEAGLGPRGSGERDNTRSPCAGYVVRLYTQHVLVPVSPPRRFYDFTFIL